MTIGRAAVLAAVFVCLLIASVGTVLAAPPGNDSLTTATTVGALPYTSNLSTVEATLQGSEPSPTCEVGATAIGKTVWYKYTAAANGSLIADTTGSDFDTVLAVYTGPAASPTFGTLGSIGCNDDGGGSGTSAFSFAATSGATYYFQAGGSAAEFGNLAFHLSVISANNNLSGATLALPLPYTANVTTTGATTEAGEPSPTCEAGSTFIGNTVWYKFTPSSNMALDANTNGSSYDTVLAVYSGPAVSPTFGTLSPVLCDDQSGWIDNSALTFAGAGGTTYYFQAGGAFGDSGNLVFNLAVGVDADGDGVPDVSDNCPYRANPTQALPTWTIPAGDADCDGFTATREVFVGTDPTRHCSTTTAANDEPVDTWPPDFNDSRQVTTADLLLFGPSYNKMKANNDGYNARFDLNASDSVTLPDVILIGPFYNKSCA
jgi:hypothetical protein